MPIDLKKIKALFIEEAGTADTGSTTRGSRDNQTEKAGPSPVPPDTGTASPDPESGQVSDVFLDILSQALEKENLPGMDYLEFRQSLKSLEKMAMTEQLRYQSAFAMAQAMGASRQRLLDTIGHYLTILETEERKFEQALLQQTRERIGQRQDAMARIDAEVKEKERQMESLRQDIERLGADRESLRHELQAATLKIEKTKADFLATYLHLRQEIQRDAGNLQKYLS